MIDTIVLTWLEMSLSLSNHIAIACALCAGSKASAKHVLASGNPSNLIKQVAKALCPRLTCEL